MKTIKLIEKDGNKSVGIWEDQDGVFLAMTYTDSKEFKSQNAAEKWLAKRGY